MRVALVLERFERRVAGERTAWLVAPGRAAGDEVDVAARKAAASEAVQLHLVRVPSKGQPWRVAAFSHAATRVRWLDARRHVATLRALYARVARR